MAKEYKNETDEVTANLVGELARKIDSIEKKAPYEKQLVKALDNWLKKYQRRKFG